MNVNVPVPSEYVKMIKADLAVEAAKKELAKAEKKAKAYSAADRKGLAGWCKLAQVTPEELVKLAEKVGQGVIKKSTYKLSLEAERTVALNVLKKKAKGKANGMTYGQLRKEANLERANILLDLANNGAKKAGKGRGTVYYV